MEIFENNYENEDDTKNFMFFYSWKMLPKIMIFQHFLWLIIMEVKYLFWGGHVSTVPGNPVGASSISLSWLV